MNPNIPEWARAKYEEHIKKSQQIKTSVQEQQQAVAQQQKLSVKKQLHPESLARAKALAGVDIIPPVVTRTCERGTYKKPSDIEIATQVLQAKKDTQNKNRLQAALEYYNNKK